MKLSRVFLLFIPFIFGAKQVENIPGPGYFLFPIGPGNQNYLAGTMGELRRNHFHGGIDIKTGGQIGLPVYAAADGYVSRVSIVSGGYGRRLNITHPNGYFTVYGHLNRFYPELEKFAIAKQYEQEKFKLEYFPKKGEFPVKKGEIIAFSGNSGHSSAPHLHFQIRDPNNSQLDPLQFGFTEIKDTFPPILQQIALVPKNIDSHLDGFFGRKVFNVKKVDGQYFLKDTLEGMGKFGLEFRGYDKMNVTWNRMGIQAYEIKEDGNTIFKTRVDGIPVLLTRMINLHTNYKTLALRGRWYQKGFIESGNRLPIYEKSSSRGYFSIKEKEIKKIELILEDALKNKVSFTFWIKGKPQKQAVPFPIDRTEAEKLSYSREGNILKFKFYPLDGASQIKLYVKGEEKRLGIKHFEYPEAVFLWDLRNGLLDSVRISSQSKTLSYNIIIPKGQEFTFYDRDLEIKFFKSSLFDTLFLTHEYDSGFLKIGNPLIPLRNRYRVSLKPEVPIDLEKDKLHAYVKLGKEFSFQGGNWKEDRFSFSTRTFGQFEIKSDTTPPTIKYLGLKYGRARFSIGDNLSGIKSFQATLDSSFILLEPNSKISRLKTRLQEPGKPLKGEFVLEVIDRANNSSKINLKF